MFGQKTLSVIFRWIISDGHVIFSTGFLCGCIGGIFSLLKYFPVLFSFVFQFLLSEISTQSIIYWQILCICPFDNLYVIHLKSSVKEFLAAPLPGFFLPYLFFKLTLSKLISIQYFRYLSLCKIFVHIWEWIRYLSANTIFPMVVLVVPKQPFKNPNLTLA